MSAIVKQSRLSESNEEEKVDLLLYSFIGLHLLTLIVLIAIYEWL